MTREDQRKNRLAGETSPYLLQHASNPVEWFPWGEEALRKARAEDKPIFLSVGYSACHWCHVMERESFENDAIAKLLNEHFISIKVDREERPDVDEIYMKAVQAMTGQGGWPMSVFLTPELEPFYGGTYFPPRRAYGRPGFAEIVDALARAWRTDRERAIERGRTLAKHIADEARAQSSAALDASVLDRSLAALTQAFDADWGGFGSAPKFPHALDVRLCLRHALRTGDTRAKHVALFTLDKMASGGIHDQLGGGFHRYSVDERWLIPHFEKMLYDNALLIPAYLEAFLVTGEPRFADVARRACEWTLREMTTPQGGFASAQDADSEGEEGKFFAWTPREIEDVLGAKLGRWTTAWFGVTDEGNFEHGKSALWRPQDAAEVSRELSLDRTELERAMEDARPRLLAARSKRVAPMTDDKVLASWNGLMISALALAAQVLGDERFAEAARRAARFVLQDMRQPDGRLFATARAGKAHLNAYLDDYAFMIQGLIDLYEFDFDPHWLREAMSLDRVLAERFEDSERGGFFTTASDHEALIARLKSPQDGALPSGNGVHAVNLLRLAEFTGSSELAARAQRTVQAFGAYVNSYAIGFSQLLFAADWLAAGPREIVIAGEPDAPAVRALLDALRRTFLPQRVVALADQRADPTLVPLLRDKQAGSSGARAYVCRNWSCTTPVETPADLRAQLVSSG